MIFNICHKKQPLFVVIGGWLEEKKNSLINGTQ